MKTILFHTDNLTVRGTNVALFDYAKYNQSLLNNKSIICYNKELLTQNISDENSKYRNIISNKFRNNFEVFEYSSHDELEEYCKNVDYIYKLKAGFNDYNYVNTCKNLNHIVFNYNDPHGHRYVYISKWLSKFATGNDKKYVDHIINPVKVNTRNLRDKLNIKDHQFVVGRIGGFHEFDILEAKVVVQELIKHDKDIIFIFVNTENFVEHPQAIFLEAITDETEKSDFINSCDCMIHARGRGESFGISICEFLFYNKPVLAANIGIDRNHIEILSKTELLYNSKLELKSLIHRLKDGELLEYNYSSLVKDYEPEVVMKKFNEEFLE